MGPARPDTAWRGVKPAQRAGFGCRSGAGAVKKPAEDFPKRHFRPCSDLP